MKPKFYTIITISFVLLFSACKSASKSYEAGNYDEAVELAIRKIQKDPDNREARSILKNAYRYAVEDREKNIAQLSTSNNEMKWERIYNEYIALQRLTEAIKRSPEARQFINATDYTSYVQTYQEKAGDRYVELGMKWMAEDEKLSYRKAYLEFKRALYFMPGNTDIKNLMEEAYEQAIVHIAVITPEQHVGYRYTSNSQRQFENNIVRNLQQNINNEFIRFHSTFESKMQPIDQVMELFVTNINIGRTNDQKNTREVSKEVVVKEIVHKKDSVTREYGKVYAKIITTQRQLKSQGIMMVTLRDMDERRIWNETITGNHVWESKFSHYTGDERALSDEDRRLISQQESKIPTEDEIIDAIYRDINRDLIYQVRNYINRTY